MFKVLNPKDDTRRPFQITIGLKEGYGTGVIHTQEGVLAVIATCMRLQLEANSPILPGTLIPGTMLYGENTDENGIKIYREAVVLYVGEVNPLYNAHLPDGAVINLLFYLASQIGEHLNQTRMYVAYRDDIYILQNDKAVHSTDGPATSAQSPQRTQLRADIAGAS